VSDPGGVTPGPGPVPVPQGNRLPVVVASPAPRPADQERQSVLNRHQFKESHSSHDAILSEPIDEKNGRRTLSFQDSWQDSFPEIKKEDLDSEASYPVSKGPSDPLRLSTDTLVKPIPDLIIDSSCFQVKLDSSEDAQALPSVSGTLLHRSPEPCSNILPKLPDRFGEDGFVELKQEINSDSELPSPRKRRKKSEIVESGEDRRPVSNCMVCGDKAIAHMHYGGICCYSCKAFFRRAVQSGKDLRYKCKGDGTCPVTVTNRRGCQKCRFEKCKEIGMVPTWVLSDAQCQMRFGKSKLKRKDGYNIIKTETESAMAERVPVPRLAMQEPRLTDNDELSIEYMSCVYEASKELISFSDENTFIWEKLFQETGDKNQAYSSKDISELVKTVIKKNIFFLEANSYFKKLCVEDKSSILRKNMNEMCQLRGALRFDPRDKKFLWYFNQKDHQKARQDISQDKKEIDEGDLKSLYKCKNAARVVIKTMERIARVGLSSEAILILMHVVIFSSDGLELENSEFVEQVQQNYFNLLHRYLKHLLGAEAANMKFSHVVSLIVDLRELCEEQDYTETKVANCD